MPKHKDLTTAAASQYRTRMGLRQEQVEEAAEPAPKAEKPKAAKKTATKKAPAKKAAAKKTAAKKS